MTESKIRRAPKKPAVKPKKTDLEVIIERLKALGYRIYNDRDWEYNLYLLDEDDDSNEYWDQRIENSIVFNTESLPFCCGVEEIGNLVVEQYKFNKKEEKLGQATELMVKYAFIHARKANVNDTKRPIGTMVMYCGNGQDASAYVETILRTMPDYYVQVPSRIVNNSSKNTITMFVGNYNF